MTDFDLQCLLICPDRSLATAFLGTVSQLRAFQILGDLEIYPPDRTLDMRLRQLQPGVVLLDVTNSQEAARIIHYLRLHRPTTQIIGLHSHSDAVLPTLRMGANEFLHAPFDLEGQREAVVRIRRLRRPTAAHDREPGRVICISAAKPGAGASTIARELALSLEQRSNGRVLLIDGDLAGGTTAAPDYDVSLASILDGLSTWHRETVSAGSIEVIPAPTIPQLEIPQLMRLPEFFDDARRIYDWIVIDLPVIFERLSLIALSAADVSYLVSTGELPSLHHARRALGLLNSVGFGKDAVRILVNRMSKQNGLDTTDLQKVFSTPVEMLLPQDYPAIHRRSIPDSDLGKAIRTLASRIDERFRVENAA